MAKSYKLLRKRSRLPRKRTKKTHKRSRKRVSRKRKSKVHRHMKHFGKDKHCTPQERFAQSGSTGRCFPGYKRDSRGCCKKH